MKVVLYVVRCTYGFRRTSDRISVARMSMGHGSFSTTMKYYTGVPADLQKQPAEALSESCFSESQTGRRWTLYRIRLKSSRNVMPPAATSGSW